MSRATEEDPSGNQPDDGDCVVCGGEADGIDARILEPICEWCALLHLGADLDADDVDRGDGPVTDGGEDQFSVRVGEMVREIEEEIDGSTKAEAMLYARCCAAFEHAYNHTDLPAENALGVVTAALFEAADTVGYAGSDVIETAREHYVDEDDVDRGDGVETDGGRIPEGQPIGPLVCPRGHHSVKVGASRFGCETCRSNDLEPARWDRSELVDLRSEEPPLADDGDERGRLVTDGGREPVASTGGGRHAPAMGGSTTPERTYAHYCDEVGSTVYAPRRRCPLKCYEDDP
jgi:hypothetical protein